MKSGWRGGIAAVLVAAALGSGCEAALFVNGSPVSVSPGPHSDGGTLLVPVLAFAPLVGIEATAHEGTFSLRWSGGRDELMALEVREIAGASYVPVEDLVRRVGGAIHRKGGDTYVDVPVAQLVELSADADGVLVRLDRFAPTLIADSGDVRVVRFSDCRVDTAETTTTFGPAGMGCATVVALEGPACEVRVTFLEVAALAVRSSDEAAGYSLLLTPSETSTVVSSAALGDGLTCTEARVSEPDRIASAACVRIESWRDDVSVRPLLPADGAGASAPLGEIAAAGGAVVAVSSRSGSEPGVVVIGGVPYSLGSDAELAISFDLLGEFTPLHCGFAAAAVTLTERIALDGISRSVGYDEIIGYPPGYTGAIARGFPDRFLAVRIRDGAAVSILDEAFVVAAPSATLLVASGAACVRLGGLALGDHVDLVCETTPERRRVSDAATIDGLLLWDGSPGPSLSPALTWSLAGTDWQGGLFFVRVAGSAELTTEDVMSVLSLLSLPLRNVVVLERDGAAALELRWAGYRAYWGTHEDVLVGLGAILK